MKVKGEKNPTEQITCSICGFELLFTRTDIKCDRMLPDFKYIVCPVCRAANYFKVKNIYHQSERRKN